MNPPLRNSGRRFGLAILACSCWCVGCAGIVDDQAHQTLVTKIGSASYSVYPSFIRSRETSFDDHSAMQLVTFIEDEHFGSAFFVDQETPMHGKWGHNQARMLRESASDFAAHIQSHPMNTDYAVMAECLMSSKEVVGAHLYVLDAQGRVAAVVLANSHHPEFASRSPKTVADCHAVIEDIVKKNWEAFQARDPEHSSATKP